jgi:predicted HTH transcriptional regulator
MSGNSDIGDRARDGILPEIVGFANARGGTLVLGVAETKDKPPRAHAIEPLPRIGELSRRFEDQARSCIDPPLTRLQARAIDTGDGKGVIIFRVGASRAAPHRLSTTRDALRPPRFKHSDDDNARNTGHDFEPKSVSWAKLRSRATHGAGIAHHAAENVGRITRYVR